MIFWSSKSIKLAADQDEGIPNLLHHQPLQVTTIPNRIILRTWISSDLAAGSGEEEEEEQEGEGINGQSHRRHRSTDRSPLSDRGATATSAAASAAVSPASATINLSTAYMHAVNTNSYKEIWHTIHRHHSEEGEASHSAGTPSPDGLIERVLQPDRASIEEALRGATPNHLTRLISDYFDSSENTSLVCLSLRRIVDRARAMYAPIGELIDLLPSADGHHAFLTHHQCDWAFDRLLEFDLCGNPFPVPSSSEESSFHGMRGCFSNLKQQLDLRLFKARRKRRLAYRATRGIGAGLILFTVGLAVAGAVLATHAIVVIMVGPSIVIGGCLPTRDLRGGSRPRQRDYMAQLDAASRGAYVLNNDLETIERLVARLHANVESDRDLVRLGLESGRGQQHQIEEVLRQFRRNHPSFLNQLEDLEEHICCFLASINSSRSLLLRQIQHQPPPP
ncbi:hypothetical protein ZIOFF_024766 [Zingiber officinale]|uniref:Uncharacterized protein n=1 Tax=Zingiber officinale TaxID=94328 RepID=A0A8J5LDR6_ZINOF|nr:hypothetical protein ZIOFF_024766 [Zingiber officinale]